MIIRYVTVSYIVVWYIYRVADGSVLYRAFLKARCEGGTCSDAGVTVRVTNAMTGQGISGATVEVGGQSATADSSGSATIRGLSASSSSGSQNMATVQVSASGYVSQSTNVNLVCGQLVSNSECIVATRRHR